jgi:transcriptional regulator with XRE-family HTH domain
MKVRSSAGVAQGMDAEKVTAQVIRSTLDVGSMVRQQRRKQGVRIDDAAALVGVSVDLFSRLENGKGGVRLDKLLTVLDGMGLSMVVAPKNDSTLQLLRSSGIPPTASAFPPNTDNGGK